MLDNGILEHIDKLTRFFAQSMNSQGFILSTTKNTGQGEFFQKHINEKKYENQKKYHVCDELRWLRCIKEHIFQKWKN